MSEPGEPSADGVGVGAAEQHDGTATRWLARAGAESGGGALTRRVSDGAERLLDAAGGPLDLAIVLGSGLAGAVVNRFTASARLPYAALPGMPTSAVAGHPGEALVGVWHGRRVVVFAGRAHLYQGYTAREVAHPVRLAAAAGARTMLLTNAAGGLSERLRPGDLMLIADHLNLTGASPLVGDRDAPPRFIEMADAYDPGLRAAARAIAARAGIPLVEGVYASVLGPEYETPAQARMLRLCGADAVGMSTVVEAIAARDAGLAVLGVSLIANVAAAAGLCHADVLAASAAAVVAVGTLIDGIVAGAPTHSMR